MMMSRSDGQFAGLVGKHKVSLASTRSRWQAQSEVLAHDRHAGITAEDLSLSMSLARMPCRESDTQPGRYYR